MGYREQGKIQLPVRMPRKLHDWIRSSAAADNVSMSEFATRILFDAMVRAEMRAAGRQIEPRPGLDEIRRRLEET